MSPLKFILIGALQLYRWVISPMKLALFGSAGRCRYSPSCSAYMLEAVRLHGVWHGSRLGLGRLCRCHPWGGSGTDPVPDTLDPDRHRRAPRVFVRLS